ncbi:MAG: hypothetical protein Q7W51_08860 [Coriobacteriia bacterium]|nr:hypothetical protein [Coriobacteriia bacterium]
MESNEATNLYVETDKKALFGILVQALSTEKSRAENKEAFLLAASYGFRMSTSKPLGRKDSYIKTSGLSAADRGLMAAIGLASQPSSSPPSMNECYAIAETYANAGIDMLEEKLADMDVFRFWLNAQVFTAASESEVQWPFARQDGQGE